MLCRYDFVDLNFSLHSSYVSFFILNDSLYNCTLIFRIFCTNRLRGKDSFVALTSRIEIKAFLISSIFYIL